MYKILPQNLIRLADCCPFPLYVVGGLPRDFLAGFNVACADTDICAPVSAEEFVGVARSCGFTADAVYKNTGTVKLSKDGESYEFASFRSDRYIRGEHMPAETVFTEDIAADARRRDFKCNAVYYEIRERQFKDPLGGIADINRRVLSTTCNAAKVFGEDGLRLMRLARLAAQTGFEPDRGCLEAARRNKDMLRDVSAERIYGELCLILTADGKNGLPFAHYRGLEILKDTGVLGIILPELCAGDKMPQRADFHKYDVLEHSLRCARYADREIRLAALLHDVGKPLCFNTTGKFVGHEEAGGKIAAAICSRLKVPKKLSEEVVRLVETHMYDFRGDAKERKVRRFILVNRDIFGKILMLKQADFSACADSTDIAPTVAKFKHIYAKMLREGAPFTLKELAVKGGDLLAAGFPARKVGDTLLRLLEDCALGDVPNAREKLLARALKIYL